MWRYQLARSDCSFQTHLHSIHLKKVVDEKLHSCHDGPVCLPSCDLQEQSPLLPSLNCDTLTVIVIGLENVSTWSSLKIEGVMYFHCSLKPRPLGGGSGFETIYIDWQSNPNANNASLKVLYQAIPYVNNTYSEVPASTRSYVTGNSFINFVHDPLRILPCKSSYMYTALYTMPCIEVCVQMQIFTE